MSLKTILHKHLVDNMISKVRKNESEYVVLVVDKHTTKILSSCCRMYDLMEVGVLVLESLHLVREKLDFAAIYFISNESTSISRVIDDFKDAKKPQYSSAHLFFTGAVSSNEMKAIGAAKNLVQRTKTFQEINVDFIAQESHLFTFGQQPTAIANLFSTDGTVLRKELVKDSSQLVSLLLTLKEYPHIRYSKTVVCKAFAEFVEADIKKKITQLSDWKSNESRDRGTLLIVDRSIDPVSPIMHEYTYQAMCNDLLKINGELCTLPEDMKPESKQEGDDVLVLSEDDTLWLDFRHEHIGKVLGDVTQKFKEFKTTNNMAKLQTGNASENASVKDMIAAMKAMPTYKDTMKKYHKHVSMAEACMTKFDRKRLKELGELEQDLATGFTDEGKPIEPMECKKQLVSLIKADDVSVLDKLRLLMVYLASQGAIQEQTRKELLKDIDSRLQKAITSMTKLGVDLATKKKVTKPKHSKARLADFQKRAKTIPMALMRYVPFLHQVVSDLTSFTLDEIDYPYTSPPPSGQGKQAANKPKATQRQPRNWRGGGKDKVDEVDTRPVFIVFVLGGLTFSELRSIYEIGKESKQQIYVGTTNTLTPQQFIQGLAELNNTEFITSVKESQGAHDKDELPDPLDDGNHDNDNGSDSDSDGVYDSKDVVLNIRD